MKISSQYDDIFSMDNFNTNTSLSFAILQSKIYTPSTHNILNPAQAGHTTCHSISSCKDDSGFYTLIPTLTVSTKSLSQTLKDFCIKSCKSIACLLMPWRQSRQGISRQATDFQSIHLVTTTVKAWYHLTQPLTTTQTSIKNSVQKRVNGLFWQLIPK